MEMRFPAISCRVLFRPFICRWKRILIGGSRSSQACKYMGLDFLDFLRSGEKDIHAFAESRRGRRHRSPTSEPKALPADASAEK